jgi:hypothetical protein
MRARLPASPPTKATIGSDYARNCAKKALTRLRAHKRRLDPPRDTWPVFQTTHLASLYDALPEDADASPDTVDELLREHGVTPPSISVNTARNVLERLCLESGIRQGGRNSETPRRAAWPRRPDLPRGEPAGRPVTPPAQVYRDHAPSLRTGRYGANSDCAGWCIGRFCRRTVGVIASDSRVLRTRSSFSRPRSTASRDSDSQRSPSR